MGREVVMISLQSVPPILATIRIKHKKERKVMRIRNDLPEAETLAMNQSAGLLGDGPLDYTVPDSSARFTETEIQGYRAAFGAIAREVASIQDFKKQLNQPAAAAKKEICTSQLGVWQVRSTLLNTGPSQILLCQRQGKLAVIEKFPANTPYAVANSGAEILLQGNDAGQLEADFKAGARHTLEFMASNLTAKAQKIIWEQFPDHRPGRVIAAISERCATAVTEQETISETQKVTPSYGRGMRM
jgi:hypothetical protein